MLNSMSDLLRRVSHAAGWGTSKERVAMLMLLILIRQDFGGGFKPLRLIGGVSRMFIMFGIKKVITVLKKC